MTATTTSPLHGQQILRGGPTAGEAGSFDAADARTGEALRGHSAASPAQASAAVEAAAEAHRSYAAEPPERVAAFLEAAADAIEALGDTLLEVGDRETALGVPRLTGERGRTCGQLRRFAGIARAQTWAEPTIDLARPDRAPLPKPDVRKLRRPLGPVAVFGASNFPLAFGVAGGDAAAALAAGNAVVAKGHPAHPGVNELVAGAVRSAAEACGVDPGVFQLVQGAEPALGQALVEHPLLEAVGFTGSQRVGRALMDLAAKRERPIPVYAEMGSTNPLFALPAALEARGPALAEGLAGSVLLGVGQFCTCPGVVAGVAGPAWNRFLEALGAALAKPEPGVMLTPGIQKGLADAVEKLRARGLVETLAGGPDPGGHARAGGTLLEADAEAYRSEPALREELFGPVILAVGCGDGAELRAVAAATPGSLTATIHAEEADFGLAGELLRTLEPLAGRVVFNGFPTGVEVCAAMHHGGPYPSSSHPAATSVGDDAISRFSRVVAYQGLPQGLLPPVLRDENPGKVWRRVDGELSDGPVRR